jgi:uncharacterized protein
MNRMSWRRLTIVLAAVALIAAIATVSASGGSRAAVTPAATLTVSGNGSVSFAPDIATLTFGASSQRKTATAATAANATVMNAVLAALRSAGAQRVSTNQLSVGPAFAQGSSEIIGFVASNSVQASTSVDRIGALMDTAVAAGATSIQGPTFSSSKDQSALYGTALKAAIAQARGQAQTLAGDAGVTLGPLVSISPGSGAGVPASPASTAPPGSTPVVAPTQIVSASVTLVFSVS